MKNFKQYIDESKEDIVHDGKVIGHIEQDKEDPKYFRGVYKGDKNVWAVGTKKAGLHKTIKNYHQHGKHSDMGAKNKVGLVNWNW